MQKIVCAAIVNKEDYHVILGARHFDGWMRDSIIKGGYENKRSHWDQGFIDNENLYLDRKKAFIVARDADQIVKKTGGEDSDELFSEDLY